MVPALRQTFASRADGLKATTTLNQGVAMPWLGLGVFQVPADADATAAVHQALELGYRSIDTAALYRNERGVGRAIRESGLPRSEIFVTTKVWNDDVRQDRVAEAFARSRERLGLEVIDLYLLHWPIAGQLVSAWRVLEQLHRAGQVRAIGVSNFMVPHLTELLAAAEIVPAVNQIEFHPYLQSKALVEFCQARDIRVEAWSPLQQAGPLLRDPVLTRIARRHGRSVAQVILRWDVQTGVITIPKTVRPERMAENANIFDFALTDDDLAAIAALDRNERHGADPFNFHF